MGNILGDWGSNSDRKERKGKREGEGERGREIFKSEFYHFFFVNDSLIV